MTEWFTSLKGAFLGNGVDRWILAGLTVVLVVTAFAGIRRGARKRRDKLPPTSKSRIFFSFFTNFRPLPALLIGVGFGAKWLTLEEDYLQLFRAFRVLGIGLQLGLLAHNGVAIAVEQEIESRRQTQQTGVASLGIMRIIGQIAVWSLVLLLTLGRLGVDVTALVASLGVGGIAVALAAQNILGDLFASLSIVLDRPFEVGDFIKVGAEVGTVEAIGLKTTRIKALSGEQLVLGNADLLNSRVQNFKRMMERRVVVRFGVLYSSNPERLREVPAICRAAVERQAPRSRFDRAHFDAFAASSLEFELVYYVLSSDFVVHQDVKQAILLDLLEELPKRELEFAFPTSTVHLASAPDGFASTVVSGSPTRAG